MQQEDFKNYKDFICSKCTKWLFSSGGSIFRDVHWFKFGWGDEVDLLSGEVALLHPLIAHTLIESLPKKVKILKESPGSVLLEQIYHALLVMKPAKVWGLKKMARDHITQTQRDLYLQMSGDGDGGRETEEEDDD